MNVSRLARPITDVWEWQRRGSCRSVDISIFFASEKTPLRPPRRRDAEAKAICASCPVRPECAAQALTTGEPHGIWGGFTESERRRLVALGWEDLADHRRRRVDIAGLVNRLHGGTTAPAPVRS